MAREAKISSFEQDPKQGSWTKQPSKLYSVIEYKTLLKRPIGSKVILITAINFCTQ